MSQTHLRTRSAEIKWNDVQQQRLVSCLVLSPMPREIKIFQRRGSVNILQFTRCVQCILKNTFYESIIFQSDQPTDLTKYLKGSGMWWMRKCYINIKRPKQILSCPSHPRAKRCLYQAELQTEASSRGQRSKYQKSILEFPHAY